MLISFANHSLQSVLNFVGLVGLCHRAFAFHWSKLFLLGVSWVQTFSRGYFVGPKVFNMAVLCVCVYVCGAAGKGVIVNNSNLDQN